MVSDCVDSVFTLIKIRKFVRYKLEGWNKEFIKSLIMKSCTEKKPLEFYIYWGMSCEILQNLDLSKQGLLFIKEYLDKINNILPVKLYLIFSDEHMRFNLIPERDITKYKLWLLDQVKEVGMDYLEFLLLSDLYKKYNLDRSLLLDGWNDVNLDVFPSLLIELLSKSAKKIRPNVVNNPKDILDIVKKYIKLRNNEQKKLYSLCLHDKIMLGFNSLIYHNIFSFRFPYIILKKVGFNRDKIPWIG